MVGPIIITDYNQRFIDWWTEDFSLFVNGSSSSPKLLIVIPNAHRAITIHCKNVTLSGKAKVCVIFYIAHYDAQDINSRGHASAFVCWEAGGCMDFHFHQTEL